MKTLNLKTSRTTFDSYQLATGDTAVYPNDTRAAALSYVALGLAGEAGEIANKVKKIIRDDNGVPTSTVEADLAAELGDVLWYLTRLADEIGYSLETIAAANLLKLADRKQRGVLKGSGDTR